MRPAPLTMLCFLLAGCPAGDDNGDPAARSGCVGSFIGAQVELDDVGRCSVCSYENLGHAADGVRGSFAGFRMGNGDRRVTATAPQGVVYAGGSFAGALMLIPAAYAPQTQWTITTLLDGIAQETRTAANADGGDPGDPSGSDDVYGFVTTRPFDAVQIGFTGGVPGLNTNQVPEFRIYEFCSDR